MKTLIYSSLFIIGVLVISSIFIYIYADISIDRDYKKYYNECFTFKPEIYTDLAVLDYYCSHYANYMLMYGSDHFVCYYPEDSECGKTKYCSQHVVEELCIENGGYWFRENSVMDMNESARTMNNLGDDE
jgi:hypothetical protein